MLTVSERPKEEPNLKLKSQSAFAFVLAIAAFAGFALPSSAATITLAPATITTSLNQCESQEGGPCVDAPLASYNGNLSGFSTETVGAGAFLTASGFSSPTLTSDVPTSTANAADQGELEYLIEAVGATGPVSLGVDSTGSISIDTTGSSNDAILFTLVQLELLSDESGTPVFNDEASLVYSAGFDPTTGVCTTSNSSTATSTIAGVATVSASPSCGGSTGSGGFDDTNSYIIQANSPYLVVMQADLTIGTDNGSDLTPPPPTTGTVEGVATVDPIFTVPGGYTLELSSGVGNAASSTPEPATWVMFAAGMGLLGMAARRRRGRSVE
jgi:hypothetical protein